MARKQAKEKIGTLLLASKMPVPISRLPTVSVHACMYVCMYLSMYVCMYVCTCYIMYNSPGTGIMIPESSTRCWGRVTACAGSRGWFWFLWLIFED